MRKQNACSVHSKVSVLSRLRDGGILHVGGKRANDSGTSCALPFPRSLLAVHDVRLRNEPRAHDETCNVGRFLL